MGYYDNHLAGDRLRRCYEIAPPRVQQYLRSEIDHAATRVVGSRSLLELGCGYGRVAFELAAACDRIAGVDTSAGSIALARRLAGDDRRFEFHVMDATAMGFPDRSFDAVVCVQNGICAFNVDQLLLAKEAARVCRGDGRILFSSYAESFWPHRLEWFERQAAEGLLGEIDYGATGDGIIVCKDGFRAGFMPPLAFESLCRSLDLEPRITEVDGSSVFCEAVVP